MSDKRTTRLKERAKRTRSAAHERVIKDGTIQFRLDAANMERLLKLADDRRIGAGVLSRMWVLERLNHESATKSTTTSIVFDAPLTSEEIQLMRAVSRSVLTPAKANKKSFAAQLTQLQAQIGTLSRLMQDMLAKQA